MIILDTNIASELMRASPAPAVLSWMRRQRASDLFTTAITVAEIRYGIERLPAGRRQDLLRSAARDVFSLFSEQILPFDAAAAEEYALVVSRRDSLGLQIDGFGAQIAAICRARGAALATRNMPDFRETRVEVVDPWRAES
jgi:toxin FitB